MKRRTALGIAAVVACACNAEAPRREQASLAATASTNPTSKYAEKASEGSKIAMAGLASTTPAPSTPYPFLQDTARTVTRRIWADASLGSVSPDGRYATITDWDTGDLAIRDLETGEVRLLTHNPGSWDPGFADGHLISRDGEWVAVSWCEFGENAGYRLAIVPMTGGNLRFISDTTFWIGPLDWSPDGAFVLAIREAGPRRDLLTVSVRDGSTRVLKTFQDPAPSGFVRTARFSPDGRFVAYAFHKPGDETDWDIYAIDVATVQEHVLVQSPAFDDLLGWAPDGNHILFQSDRGGTPGAWLLPVSDGAPSGAPWLVKPDLWRAQGLGFGNDGRFFYTVETGRRDVFVASLDSETGTLVGSATTVIPRSLGDGLKPLWSPDGTHLAYAAETGPVPMQSWPWSPQSIVIQSMETGAIRELGLHVSGTPRPAGWTPDGRGIFVVTSNLNDPEIRNALYRVDIQTSDEEVVLELGHDHDLAGMGLSPDARTLFVAGAGVPWDDEAAPSGDENQLRRYRLVRMNLETGAFTELFQTPPGGPGMIRGLRPSPDGQTVAFGYCPPGGPDRLVLIPARGGELREIVAGTFSEVAWMPGGDALLAYGSLEKRGEDMEVFYVDLEERIPHPVGIFGEDLSLMIDVHPDGHRIAYTSGTTGSELWVMENFLPGASGADGPEPEGE
jgi:Tol biopolymer transport system component